MLTKVNELIKENLRNKNKVETNVFKLVKADLINNEKSQKPRPEIDVVKSYNKRLTKSLDAYASRPDIVEKLTNEINIVKTLLPVEVTETVIRDHVSATVQNILSAKDPLNMGPIIGSIKKQLPNADGSLVAKIVREKLSEI